MSVVYESKETRDMVIKTGMESGVSASFDRLEGVLAAQAARP
jgi:hypothetical protein